MNLFKNIKISFIQRVYFILFLSFILSACGFHLQGQIKLAKPLHRLYLQTPDPYGILARSLKQNLKTSQVSLAPTVADANAILVILQDTPSSTLLGVSGTNQTRQYSLAITVVFEITDVNGRIIVAPQMLNSSQVITIQSNQVLGSSNLANTYYQQMRRQLAYAIMTRLASKEVSNMVNKAFTE